MCGGANRRIRPSGVVSKLKLRKTLEGDIDNDGIDDAVVQSDRFST